MPYEEILKKRKLMFDENKDILEKKEKEKEDFFNFLKE